MLRYRVLTSVVLALLVIAALLLLSPLWLAPVLAALVLVIGGWEAARLAGLQSVPVQMLFVSVLLLIAGGLVYMLHWPAAVPWFLGAAFGGWLGLSVWLVFPEFGRPSAPGKIQPWRVAMLGAILLAAFGAILWLHAQSPWQMILMLLIIAAADIGAYFTGSWLGGPRLAPRISPGKTWSGVAGGIVAAVIVAALAAHWLPRMTLPSSVAAAAAIPLVAISICGDLMFSLFKRHRGIKDTSSLLPGHGGLLDRIDSVSAAAPAFALLVWFQAAVGA